MKVRHFRLILTALALTALLASISPASASPQSTIIIATHALDVLDNDDGFCSLREAVIAANTDTASGSVSGECPAGSGADTISLFAGQYTLTIPGDFEDASAGGDLDISSSIRISGKGTFCTGPQPQLNCTKIEGKTSAPVFGDRIFHVLPTGNFTLDHVQFSGGDEGDGWGGGGIFDAGILHLDHVLVIGNTSTNAGGGLMINWTGTATITNSSFAMNSAPRGGGIHVQGPLTMSNSSVTLNTAANMGGGIFNEGSLVRLSSGYVSHNKTTLADGSGGGIYNTGNMTLSNSNVTDNTTIYSSIQGRYGGGIYNSGTLNISNSLILNNSAGINGGGIYAGGTGYAPVSLVNTTLSGNSAGTDGGALGFYGTSSGTLNHVTIAGNTAGTDGGAILMNTSNQVHIGNSILSDNGNSDCYNYTGNLISDGYNIEEMDECGLSGLNDETYTDPELGPLQDNGGFSHTFALLAGSPAIDSANPTGCPAIDQRGYFRPADGDDNGTRLCDIGAFELNGLAYGLYLPAILRP